MPIAQVQLLAISFLFQCHPRTISRWEKIHGVMIKVKYRQKKNTQMIGEKKKERKKQINEMRS